MGLLYRGNFEIHQWLLSKIRNPAVVLEIHESDFALLGNFGIHQCFLSRIGNPVVVL